VVRRVLAGEFDVLTFASPSAAANFAALCGREALAGVSAHAKIAVIGETTADAVRNAGLPVDIVAPEATASGLVRGIEAYFTI
jgi:uroporphyrinogen-III synthase/uroporphyrinogen III methyltransferase/synthase